jgi:hypothetical protein
MGTSFLSQSLWFLSRKLSANFHNIWYAISDCRETFLFINDRFRINAIYGHFRKAVAKCDYYIYHIYQSVCLSICPHDTVRLSWDGFGESSNLGILVRFVDAFRSYKSNRHFTWRPTYGYVTGLTNEDRRVFSVKYEQRTKKQMTIVIYPVLWDM